MPKAAFASLVVLAGALGCQTILDLTPGTLRGNGGDGGIGTSVSSASRGGGGGGGGSGGSGGDECDPEACPRPESPCKEVYCSESGQCSARNLDVGTPCGENQECDAEGVCRTKQCANGEQDGDETGVDCGGSTCPLCPTLLLLTTGDAGVIAGEYHGRSRGWSVKPIVQGTGGYRDPVLTITAEKQGIGILSLRPSGAPSSELHDVRWSPSGWVAQVSPIRGVSSISAPSIDSGLSGALLIYQRQDTSHATLTWTGQGWSESQPVVQGGRPSSGPSAATLVMQGELATIAFLDDDNILGVDSLFSQRREDGAWQEPEFAAPDVYADFPPVMIALDPSPHLLLVYAQKGSRALHSVYHDGSGWSNPQRIVNAIAEGVSEADFQYSVAALKGDRAILAYRDVGEVRVAHFDGERWTADDNIGSIIRGVPAVARGIDGADAELMYVSTDGSLRHARLMGDTWTAAERVGAVSNVVNIALTSVP